MQSTHQSTLKSVVFGFVLLAAGQTVIAAVMISRNIPDLDSEFRAKAVATVSAIALSGAFLGWYITCRTQKLASCQPALGVAGALVANLIRLIVPLLALAFLQTSAAEAYLGGTLQKFVRETLVASYLVLLLLDILLHIGGYGKGVQSIEHHTSEKAQTQNNSSI